MENLTLLLTLFIFISITHTVLCVDTCEPASCNPDGPQVRFPFRLINQQPQRCGYPGFDLSCNNKSQLLVNLPLAGDFEVISISYISRTIYIKPDFCFPDRILAFNPLVSPFVVPLFRDYTFLNCSLDGGYPVGDSFQVVDCVRNENSTVVVVPTRFYNGYSNLWLPETCRSNSTRMTTLAALMWPSFCERCERENGTCGFKNEDSLEIGCSGVSKQGLSAAAKFGIILGAGVPGLLLLICLAKFAKTKIDYRTHIRRHNATNLPTTSIVPQPPMFVMGLDKLTIDSYPMTVLGESKRLPKPSDSTCAICLSEYQPKDTLRTVPECNHYFHSKCIDEWLKLNATCPVCRNSPEGSSSDRVATPMSSVSSSTSLFST